MHWSRFNNRMNELKRKDKWFKDIISEKEVTINNKKLLNAPVIVEKLMNREQDFQPEFVGRWSHSDLHFSNVLIDEINDDFVLIDPRGTIIAIIIMISVNYGTQ